VRRRSSTARSFSPTSRRCRLPAFSGALPVCSVATADKTRVYNILEHKKESESIVFEDPDPNNGFVILPDMSVPFPLYRLCLSKAQEMGPRRSQTALPVSHCAQPPGQVAPRFGRSALAYAQVDPGGFHQGCWDFWCRAWRSALLRPLPAIVLCVVIPSSCTLRLTDVVDHFHVHVVSLPVAKQTGLMLRADARRL
jgi:hypothetical protein